MNDTPIYDRLCSIYGPPLAYPRNGTSEADTVEFAISALPNTAHRKHARTGGHNPPGQGWFEDSPLPEPQFQRPGGRPHVH